MKVALINDHFALTGGTERHILDAAQLLESAGVETVYIARDAVESPVTPHLLPDLFKFRPFNKQRTLSALPSLEALLQQHQVDVVHLVHIHNPVVTDYLTQNWPTVRTIHTPYLFCVAGTRYLPHTQRVCGQRCGITCLSTHMVEGCIRYNPRTPYPLRHKVKKLWEIFANHAADHRLHGLGVASTYMEQLLIEHDYPADRISVMHPPLTEALEAITPGDFPLDSPPTLVFAGRLIAEKGAFDILQAMVRMKTPAHLIIAGDGPEREHLEKDVATLGLQDRVRFLGWLSPLQSRHLYRDAWVTVFPSHWPEPFGFSGIESFLNGRPTVAYNVGGISEWLVDGKNGLLVDPHDVHGLARALDSLLSDPPLIQEMGRWASQDVRIRFGRQVHLNAKLAFYEQAIARFGREHPSRQATAVAR